jgi:outer membrane biosynthesis protein TonB
MSASVAIHVAVVLVVFALPRAWLLRDDTKPLLMTISLGGSLGERSGGMVAAGARPVEQVAPTPKRPEPIPPATPKKAKVIATPAKAPAKTPPKPADASATLSATTRPPTTGAQVTRGTAVADTGATGQGTGLTFGGGAGGAMATVDSDFCCKDYIDELIRRINAKWPKVQPETGMATLVFEIRKDGTFSRPVVEKSSGSVLLDVASRSAFDGLVLPPLPREYSGDSLKIHLTFPYVR